MSKTKNILKIIGRVAEAMYIVAMLSFSCVAIFSGNKSGTELSGTPINHYTILTVRTESMKGTFDKNALVLAQIPSQKQVMNLKATVRDAEGNMIEKGDIISFPAYIGGQKAINTHRIEAIEYIDGIEDINHVLFHTKGDNAEGVDLQPTLGKNVLAIYKGSIPKVGGWIMNIKEGKTFIYVVICPLAALFVYNIFIFMKNLSEMKAEKMALEKGAELSDEEKEKLKQEYLRSLQEENKKE